MIGVSWAPGKKGNAPLPRTARLTQNDESTSTLEGGMKRKLHEAEAPLGSLRVGDFGVNDIQARPCIERHEPQMLRVWAFGREEVRRKIWANVPDFAEMVTDFFVA